MRRDAPSGSLTLDRAEIAVAPAKRGLRFNGEPIPLPVAESGSDAQLGWYGSSRLFRESFRRNSGWRGFHGAALRIGQRGVVLVADSGAGKTTLALSLLARGAGFYSDEFAFVRCRDRLVRGYPRTLVVRRETLELLANERLQRLCAPSRARPTARGHVWDFVDVSDLFGPGVLAEPAPLGAIVLLAREDGARLPVLEPLPAALAALNISPRLNSAQTGFSRLTGLAELLAGTPAYRLTLGLPAPAAELLWERLR
jgi:hypothetical protein